jgi:hypothetical protein
MHYVHYNGYHVLNDSHVWNYVFIILFQSPTNPAVKTCYFPYFSDEEPEAQKDM